MTGSEKTALASFLDLADDYLSGGFGRPRADYFFPDDALRNDEQPPPARAVVTTEITHDAKPERGAFAGDKSESGAPADSLEAIAGEIAVCTRCGLCETRTKTVPGEGVPNPLVMVIGEGPGADEDTSGRPFVGRAGQLLDRMLDSRGQIGLSRNSNCYIANVIKCRPPGNRNPQPDEVAACVPFLTRQIKIIRPKVILAAGNTAAKTLLDSSEGITRLRGLFAVFKGTVFTGGDFDIPLLPTFHPSALLRDESLKAPVWEDMKTLRAKLRGLDEAYDGALEAAGIPR